MLESSIVTDPLQNNSWFNKQRFATVIEQHVTDDYAVYRADCVGVARGLPDNSLHFSIWSPPFLGMYQFTDAVADMSNVTNDQQLMQSLEFLIIELARIMMPGRLVAIHCMNIPATIEHDGYIGVKDFRGELIRAFIGADQYAIMRTAQDFRQRAFKASIEGDRERAQKLNAIVSGIVAELDANPAKDKFIYHSEVLIWKDPLVAATRTHALGLAHKQIVKDSSLCRQGLPDYLVVMRKPGDNPEAISHEPSGFTRYVGDPALEPRHEHSVDHSRNKYSHHVWQRYASPCWLDINPSDTLQRTSARHEDDSKHIAPLQLTVIRRAIELWTNPGDVVLSAFAGIGSEGYVALQEGRKFIGAELKSTYYDQCVRNLDAAIESRTHGMLFEEAPNE